MSKLKNYCDIYTGNSISDSDKDKYSFVEGAIPYISTKDIDLSNKTIDYCNGMYISDNIDKFKIAPKNSTLLCIEGGSAGKKIGFLKEDVCFVNKLCCFANFKGNPKFLYYYLQGDTFVSEFNLNMTGLIGGVSQSVIKNMIVTFPDDEKQNKVVDYLDKKCSKIDKVIEDNNKEIELLEEYKLNIVNDELKKIKNCKYGRLKLYMYEVNERNSNPEAELLSVFTKIGVDKRVNMEDRGNKAVTVLNYKIVKRQDMIVNKLLAWMGAFGVSNYDGVTSPDYDVYRFRDNSNPLFYHYYFRYSKFKEDCYKEGHGIMLMRWRTYPSELLNIIVPHPSIIEQNKIVEELEKKFTRTDKIIEYRKKIIEKLEEYKKSLIYEVVTGKKEV